MSERDRLIDRIKELTGWTIRPNRFKIITDTTEWMEIHRGHIIRIGGVDYIVRGNMNEPRFGIDDQPKYWVFNTIQLETGMQQILKTVFHEEFTAHIGIFRIRCYRDPDKESKTLDLVSGDDRFMQGKTVYDDAGNNVRIIDYIRGSKFFHSIPNLPKTHREYFEQDLPEILWKLNDSFKAIEYLHRYNLFHGDIRNDHIIIEHDTGNFRWIDFDLKQDVSDFDLWSIGNILCYAVAKGIKPFDLVLKSDEFSDEVKNNLTKEDSSAFYEYRIMNLKKLYDYIPDKLNDILLHFTIKPKEFYSSMHEFIEDYEDMLRSEFPQNITN